MSPYPGSEVILLWHFHPIGVKFSDDKEVTPMSKPRDSKKEQKKKPKMTLKEKRQAKREKKQTASSFSSPQ
jgi:hypothetical protein